jgi:hypothetical protein
VECLGGIDGGVKQAPGIAEQLGQLWLAAVDAAPIDRLDASGVHVEPGDRVTSNLGRERPREAQSA